ncbi:MAG: hypothetical protein ACKVU4_11980 [Phycisphaerales bacterium]
MCSTPRRAARTVRRAFTLVDVTVGLIVASVLAVAVGGVVVLASRAVPQSASATTPTTVSAARLADEIAAELRYATAFKEMSARAVAFLVADRTGDGAEELIRYAWGGTAGDPVTRAYNAAAPAVISTGVQDLAFAYARRTETATRETTVTGQSAETLLASFGGWSGVTGTSMQLTVTPTTWVGQSFKITPGLVPVAAKNITITRVRLKMKKPTLGGGDAIVSIHRRQSAGSHLAASAAIGSPGTISFGLLTLSFAMSGADFSGVSFPASETDFTIVVKGAVSGGAIIQYLNATTAPVDTNYQRWSTDSGSSWLPSSNWDRNDAHYEVWGTWDTTTTGTVQTDTYFLTSIGVDVDAGGSQGVVRAVARVVNEPEVPAP